MRTGTPTLITAQRSQSPRPFIEVEVNSSDTDSIRYTAGSASDNSSVRLLSVQDCDGYYGASLLDLSAANGIRIPVSCIITLLDYEGVLFASTNDLRGQRVRVRWGYVTANGNEYIETPPYFVYLKRNVYHPRRPMIELYCISMWTMLNIPPVILTNAFDLIFGSSNSISVEVEQLVHSLLDDVPGYTTASYSQSSTDARLAETVRATAVFDTPRGVILRQMLLRTNSAIVIRDDSVRLIDIPDAVSYSYATDPEPTEQLFTQADSEESVVMPSKVLITNRISDPARVVGFSDTESQGIFDDVPVLEIAEDEAVTTAALATEEANRRLNRYIEESYQGEITSLPNVLLEPWDMIQTAQRLFEPAIIKTGRASRIVRVFNVDRREYSMTVSLGSFKSWPELTVVDEPVLRTERPVPFAKYRRLRDTHEGQRA